MEDDLLDRRTEPKDGVVCPACAAFVGVNEVFCPACGAPISLLANTDPLQRIYTEGYMYRKAVETKPKLIVVIGIWIMLGPAFVGTMIGAISLIVGGIGSGFGGFIFFWILVALALFSFVVLSRVTKNYIKFEPPENDKLD